MSDKRLHDVWMSERDLPLITQPHNLPKLGNTAILTVERYCKWYDLYIIFPNEDPRALKMVGTMEDDIYGDCYGDMWRDHTMVPAELVKYAKRIGAKMELQVYDAVCRRYLQDWVGVDNVFTSDFVEDHELILKKEHLVKKLFDKDDYPSNKDLKAVIFDDDQGLLN